MMEVPERDKAVLQNLLDAGCDADLAERFFALQIQGGSREQLQLLSAHRRLLLENIHQYQKHLDCLDYLLYQMRKEKGH